MNPFEGLKRKRLPGMHMITACEGGMPLHDALAAFFFMILHDRVKHGCLIEKALDEHEERMRQAVDDVKSPDGGVPLIVMGLMESSSLAFEEWSYLDDQEAAIFYMMANTAIEQVQRWIAEGSHEPFELPLLGGKIVQRPEWAARYFGTPDSEKRLGARSCVKKLFAEVEVTR